MLFVIMFPIDVLKKANKYLTLFAIYFCAYRTKTVHTQQRDEGTTETRERSRKRQINNIQIKKLTTRGNCDGENSISIIFETAKFSSDYFFGIES